MRDAFLLDPSVVHLNHGSFGAVPRVVAEEQQRIRDRAEANPMRFFRVESAGLRAEARHVAAGFLGVGSDEVALVRNVTEAISTVLAGLARQGSLGEGDVVVSSSQSYGAVQRAIARWCTRTGATHDVVDLPIAGEQVVAAHRAALARIADSGRRVALVVVDHITSPTGTVLPVVEVAAAAHEFGALTFVDAAHVPGQLPARLDAIGADFWSGTWHKWGFAPRGTTGLWVAAPHRAAVEPLTTSWNDGLAFPLPFDVRGTDDYSAWMCLATAVQFWRDAGGPAIAAEATALLDKAVAVVSSALPAVSAPVPATPAPNLRLVPLPAGVAATLDDADGLYQRLSAVGVEVQVTPCDGYGYLRLSAAVYNEIADYERLAEVLPGILRAG